MPSKKRLLVLVTVLMAAMSWGGVAWGQTIIYVNASAPTPGNGQSWATAYNDLQDALAAAQAIPEPTRNVEIWVAAGTYKPSVPGNPGPNRTSTFTLPKNTRLYGGFVGNENALTQRDWLANQSILSGDLDGNDIGGGPDALDENCTNVVTANMADSTMALDGMWITGGWGNGQTFPTDRGGGLVVSATPASGFVVRNCTFVRNQARFGGGISGGAFSVVNCRFFGNVGTAQEGGAVNGYNINFFGCVFSGNEAVGAGPYGGGAMAITNDSRITNCTFYGNSALHGGAVCIFADPDHQVDPSLENCIFSGNTASAAGAAVYIFNRSGGPPPHIRSCMFTNYPADISGDMFIDDDMANRTGNPHFANPPGTDGMIGTPDDDLGLTSISPAIDAGLTPLYQSFPVPVLIDAANHRRVNGVRIDLGAYEFGAPLFSPRLYVREGATGANNGSSWNDAFSGPLGLTNALLVVAASPPNSFQEIWVASGTYKPSRPPSQGGSRGGNFRLQRNLAIYGGFSGTETLLSQRNWILHHAILSGDLEGDGTDEAHRGDGSYKVVYASSVDRTAVIDGFTILGGNSDPDPVGGGMVVDGGGGASVTVRNCTFRENQALSGGGAMGIIDSAPLVVASVFTNNSVLTGGRGGAVWGFRVRADTVEQFSRFIGCTFSSNSATQGGAVFFDEGSAPVLFRCDFTGNSASSVGGALACECTNNQTNTAPKLYSCRFIGNIARRGGALDYGERSFPYLICCLIAGNSATASEGGGMFQLDSTAYSDIRNCTFANNDAIAANQGAGLSVRGPIQELYNSILWGNTDANGQALSSQLYIPNGGVTSDSNRRNIIQGWTQGSLPGMFINGQNPMFADPDGSNNIPNDLDDNYGPGPNSPAIDSGDFVLVPPDSYDSDFDGNRTELVGSDAVGNPRFVNDLNMPDMGPGTEPVDRGCYEAQYDCPTCPGSRMWRADSNQVLGGNFNDPAHWSPSVPGPTHDSVFDILGTYSVAFPPDITTNLTATIRRGDVTFSLSSATYRLISTQSTALTIGLDLPQQTSLTVTEGIVLPESLSIAAFPDSNGILNVTGVGSRVTPLNGRIVVGREGTGAMNIGAGGVVIGLSGAVGEEPNSLGTVDIAGPGSRWRSRQELAIANGRVTVRDNGRLQADIVYLRQNGILDGDGIVEAPRGVVNLGEVDPGNSPGTLTINGPYEQSRTDPKFGSASGKLILEVMGALPGEYDKLVVTGQASLGGGLIVRNPDHLDLNDSIELISASSLDPLHPTFDVAFMPPHAQAGKFLHLVYPRGGGSVVLDVGTLTGEFDPHDPQPVELDGQPVAAAAGDVSGDGRVDLVVVIPHDNTNGELIVLMNQGLDDMGNVIFATHMYFVGRGPSSVALADFDPKNPGGVDIAVTNSLDNTVSVLANMGGGIFDPAAIIVLTGKEPMSVATADINGDGSPDLLIADAGENMAEAMFSRSNTPSPMFDPGPRRPAGMRPVNIIPVRPLKHGPPAFIATSNADGNSVTIIPVVGGDFAIETRTLPVGANPLQVLSADLDQDQRLDLVTVNRGDNTVSVMLGRGSDAIGPVFAPAVNLPAGGESPRSITAFDADADANHTIDLAFTVFDGMRRAVQLLRNDLNGGQLTFAPAEPLADEGECPVVVLSTNIDGDTRPDLITLNSTGECGRASVSNLAVRRFGTPPPCPCNFNGDGFLNSQDFFDFLACFFKLGCPRADYNTDGFVNSQDFFDFLSCFFAGC